MTDIKVGGKFGYVDYMAMQIKAQVDLFGQDIVLLRKPVMEDDGEGGIAREDDEPEPLEAQKLCFIEAAPIAHVARGSNYQDIIGMGQRVVTNYALVGLVDADMMKADTFVIDDYEYEIIYVHPDHDFMRLAEVERVEEGNA